MCFRTGSSTVGRSGAGWPAQHPASTSVPITSLTLRITHGAADRCTISSRNRAETRHEAAIEVRGHVVRFALAIDAAQVPRRAAILEVCGRDRPDVMCEPLLAL